VPVVSGREGILLSSLVCYLGPFIVCFNIRLVVVIVVFWRVCEFPSAGVSSGEKLVKVFRHLCVEFGALF
jgi:hypothetical protein